MDIIYNKKEVIKRVDAWVASETLEGAYYQVTCLDDDWECSCPAFSHRDGYCKHILKCSDKI